MRSELNPEIISLENMTVSSTTETISSLGVEGENLASYADEGGLFVADFDPTDPQHALLLERAVLNAVDGTTRSRRDALHGRLALTYVQGLGAVMLGLLAWTNHSYAEAERSSESKRNHDIGIAAMALGVGAITELGLGGDIRKAKRHAKNFEQITERLQALRQPVDATASLE